MWKPLVPLILLGKANTSEASKPSASKVIQIEPQPLPSIRFHSKATPAAASVAPDLACMDHDYCFSNKSLSPDEPGKRWNVKTQSVFTIKPLKQHPSSPAPSPQSATNSVISSKTQDCPRTVQAEKKREDESEEWSVKEMPDASPSQQERVTSPRRGPLGRSYRRYAASRTPSPRCSPEERTRGRSRKRFYCSPSPTSSCSDSFSSRSRSRSNSPAKKRLVNIICFRNDVIIRLYRTMRHEWKTKEISGKWELCGKKCPVSVREEWADLFKVIKAIVALMSTCSIKGPYKGRSTELIPRLKGVLTNPNCEFESNFVAIHTLATWYKSNMNGVRKDVVMSKYAPKQQSLQEKHFTAGSYVSFLVTLSKNTKLKLSKIVLDDHEKDVAPILAEDLKPMDTDKESLAESKSPEESIQEDSGSDIAPMQTDDQLKQDTYVPGPDEKPLFTPEPPTLEDLCLLAELFYLPYEHGPKATQMLKEFNWLRANSSVVSVAEWQMRAEKFQDMCCSVIHMFTRLSNTANRTILFDLYPYIWDIKSILAMVKSFVLWLGTY
ncbi:hypothetical protein XENOCAPTIV_006606 [Xenoophorus captivus]|uniref:Uncharacterized protein n=1 Tax=Xenoophorus captivus TaxID=1517983 RepID=A0ABV0R491_9TELE